MTQEGKVKVLDFGLAKAFEGDTTNDDPSNSPTLSMAATMHGVILGTAAYMSPEQARGKAVDKRTDIWAFGCVLYELLTGKPAFHGEDVTDILAAVVRAEPDWQGLPPATPLKIRDLLRRCLQKDKTLRLRDAGDARIEIQETLAAPHMSPNIGTPAKGIRALGWRALIFSLGALLLGAAITGIAVWNLKPSPAPSPKPVSRLTITLPPGQQLAGLESGPAVAISPDGTHLAYAATRGGTQQLYLGPMNSLEARPIPGTEGGIEPFFSPDGQWLGFFAGGKLKKVSVSGGGGAVSQRLHCAASRGQLGRSGHDCLCVYKRRSSPGSFGRRRRPAAADSIRERGHWPPLAGVLARRQCSAILWRRSRRPSHCGLLDQNGRTAEPDPSRDATPLRTLWVLSLFASRKLDGRAV